MVISECVPVFGENTLEYFKEIGKCGKVITLWNLTEKIKSTLYCSCNVLQV